MRMELNVAATGAETTRGGGMEEMLRIIDASGLDYRLASGGIQIEGTWEQLMDVARLCHRELRKRATRVVTTFKMEDAGEMETRGEGTIAPVEAKKAGSAGN